MSRLRSMMGGRETPRRRQTGRSRAADNSAATTGTKGAHKRGTATHGDDRRLAEFGGVPKRRPGRVVRPGCRAERGETDLPRLPGALRMPRRRTGQQDRVWRVGWDDRARASGTAPPASEGGKLAADVRGCDETEGTHRHAIERSARQRRTDLAQPLDVMHIEGLRR